MGKPAEQTTVFGAVTVVFEHKFVLDSGEATYVADIEPECTRDFGLREGDRILIKGEVNENDIRVTEIVMGPGSAYVIVRRSA